MDTQVVSVSSGGYGFDVLQHDGLRIAVRSAIGAAAGGRDAFVDLQAVAANLYPPGFSHAWQAVTCVENHDRVKVGEEQRIPSLADSSGARSWYARSRSRVATGLLLTAPGIPQLFMGQEFLEKKQWSDNSKSANLLAWSDLETGADRHMVDHLRFTQELIRLRWQQHALRGEQIRVFHVSNSDRVLAFDRWLEGSGNDVIVVVSLAESTWYGYQTGFPFAGRWLEVFNSDVYDNWVNPIVAGNGGSVDAFGPPLHEFATSAAIIIPANSIVVFARQAG